MDNIKPKEAAAIIDSLTAGVVPNIGVQKIVVGRDLEVNAILKDLERVSIGQNVMKFWIGDFGSGKSFMFHLLRALALKQKFVVHLLISRQIYDCIQMTGKHLHFIGN